MKKAKPARSFRWYIAYSIFAVFILAGVFSIVQSYALAMQAQTDYYTHFNEITANTIENFSNAAPPVYEPQVDMPGKVLLIIFGIAGFLFTKFLYERQVK